MLLRSRNEVTPLNCSTEGLPAFHEKKKRHDLFNCFGFLVYLTIPTRPRERHARPLDLPKDPIPSQRHREAKVPGPQPRVAAVKVLLGVARHVMDEELAELHEHVRVLLVRHVLHGVEGDADLPGLRQAGGVANAGMVLGSSG